MTNQSTWIRRYCYRATDQWYQKITSTSSCELAIANDLIPFYENFLAGLPKALKRVLLDIAQFYRRGLSFKDLLALYAIDPKVLKFLLESLVRLNVIEVENECYRVADHWFLAYYVLKFDKGWLKYLGKNFDRANEDIISEYIMGI